MKIRNLFLVFVFLIVFSGIGMAQGTFSSQDAPFLSDFGEEETSIVDESVYVTCNASGSNKMNKINYETGEILANYSSCNMLDRPIYHSADPHQDSTLVRDYNGGETFWTVTHDPKTLYVHNMTDLSLINSWDISNIPGNTWENGHIDVDPESGVALINLGLADGASLIDYENNNVIFDWYNNNTDDGDMAKAHPNYVFVAVDKDTDGKLWKIDKSTGDIVDGRTLNNGEDFGSTAVTYRPSQDLIYTNAGGDFNSYNPDNLNLVEQNVVGNNPLCDDTVFPERNFTDTVGNYYVTGHDCNGNFDSWVIQISPNFESYTRLNASGIGQQSMDSYWVGELGKIKGIPTRGSNPKIGTWEFDLSIPDDPNVTATRPSDGEIIEANENGYAQVNFTGFVESAVNGSGEAHIDLDENADGGFNSVFNKTYPEDSNTTITTEETLTHGTTGSDTGDYDFRVRAVDPYRTVTTSERRIEIHTPPVAQMSQPFPGSPMEQNLSNAEDGDTLDVTLSADKGRTNIEKANYTVKEDGQIIASESNIDVTGTDFDNNDHVINDVFTVQVNSCYKVTASFFDENNFNDTESTDKICVENTPPEVQIRNLNNDNGNVDFEIFTNDSEFSIDRVNYSVSDGVVNDKEFTFDRDENGWEVYTGDGFTIPDSSKSYTITASSRDTDGKIGSNTTDVSVTPPNIQDFNITPGLGSADAGDLFDFSVEGEPTENSIDTVTYSLDVTDNSDPSDVTVSVDFDDGNQFTDTEKDIFEMKDDYLGETLTGKVKVTDVEGYSSSTSKTADTSTPPERFIQKSPSDGSVFLIPENENDVEVTIDWGIETAEYNGTADLYVNGNVKDTLNPGVKETLESSYSENYTSSDNEWYIKFTDSQGDTYTSGKASFKVTDEPVALDLKSPSGDTISISDNETAQVTHDFEVDARAYANDYYYKFNLSDSQGTITTRTSTDKNTDIQNYSETVSSLENGSYSWSVNVYRSSDDVLLESSSANYDVEVNPVQEAGIISPFDGSTFTYIQGEEDNTDVNITYRIQSFENDVTATLETNNLDLDQRTISADKEEYVTVTANQLDEGTYNVNLKTEDSQGRTVNDSVSFDVEEVDEKVPEIHTIEFRPSIKEASVGDELDLYVEGSGNLSKVDYVQLEITQDGKVIDTIVVDSDELKSGSFFGTIDSALTITDALIETDLGVLGETYTLSGKITSYFVQYFVGGERNIGAILIEPDPGRTYEQVSGETEPIRHRFNVETLDNPVDYTVQIREGTGSYTDAVTGTVTSTDDVTEITEYINLTDKLGTQFGTFRYRVKVNDSSTTEYSGTRKYSVVQNDSEPNLNVIEPENKIYYSGSKEKASVPISFDVDTEESGNFSLYVDDGTSNYSVNLDNPNVNPGFSSRSVTGDFDPGTYEITVEFETENYNVLETQTFAVNDGTAPVEDSADIELRQPYKDTDTWYQGFGNWVSWSVYNVKPSTSGESTDGITTLYVEDSSGDVKKKFTREYTSQAEREVYNQLFSTDINQGDYEIYAEADLDNLANNITTNRRNLSVVDFPAPETSLISPSGDSFKLNESIPFEFTTTSYDQEITVDLLIREKGATNFVSYESSAQSEDTTQNYNFEVPASELGTGTYDYKIRSEVNPEFDSTTGTFTVEEEEVADPVINLKNPEKNDEIEISSGNSTDISFNYNVEVFSENDADVFLQLDTVEEPGDKAEFDNLKKYKQKNGDNAVEYNDTKSLEEGSYRFRIKVEHPNGDVYDSKVVSFAVDNPETDEEPFIPESDLDKETIADVITGGFTNIDQQFRASAGATGQFFMATLMVMLIGGITQFAFRIPAVTVTSMLSTTLGFSLAEGYYPLAVFWIIVASVSIGVAYMGVRMFSGGGR